MTGGFGFAFPWAWLAAVPAAAASFAMFRRARRGGVKFSAFSSLPPPPRNWRTALSAAAPVLFSAGLLCLAAAAARPRTPGAREWRRENAVAVEMVVDVSGSMLNQDMAPGKTRLDVVKKTFSDFVRRRPADLIGLVTFAGYTKTAVPLTADHAALVKMLEGVRIPDARRFRDRAELFRQDQLMTALGDGIIRALDRLRGAEPESRVIMLLSDGAGNAGVVSPEDAAEAAREAGVKIYAIGAGRAGDAFDERQLRAIADRTGGRYFEALDSKGLEAAVDEIDKLEKTDVESTVEIRWNEHFPVFLFAGLALAAAGALAGVCSSGRVA